VAAKAAVTVARAELEAAQAQLAELRDEYARLEPLAGWGVSRAEVEATQSAIERSESEVARAMARIDQSRAQAEGATADAATMRRRFENTEVRSPVTGVVVSRSVALGDVVAAGTQLFRVADPSTLYVWAPFDESVLEELRPGLPARVRFHSDLAHTYPGTVVRIGREVDVETREVQVRVALDEAPQQWALGQRAEVLLDADPQELTLAVPAKLLAWRDGDSGLYVAADGRARWVPVTLGRARADQVEIMDGVAPGDTILAPAGLRERQRVDPSVTRILRGS
jgi:HlyD family secretion protein